ncbi:MAG: hypothetical protein RSA50_01735 [Mucinivorans sp.]
MEDSDLKLLWKSGTLHEAKSYSDIELNTMVVKCAKKSMRKIRPGWILRTVAMLIVIMLLWQIITGYEDVPITILRFVLLLILTGGMAVEEWSMGKMNKYNLDMPVKEWLKFRIDKIEQSILFTRKYDIAVHAGTFVFTLGVFLMYNYLMNVPFNLLIFAAIFIFNFIYILICRMMVRKHHHKVLLQLQELYNKLEE